MDNRLNNIDDNAYILSFKATSFQEAVWMKLLWIPYGTTVAYSDLCNDKNNQEL